MVNTCLSRLLHCSLLDVVFHLDFHIFFRSDGIGKITMVSDLTPVQPVTESSPSNTMTQSTPSNTRTVMLVDLS